MSTKPAVVFVTKLGAAERQLNAAIRLFLASEDALAVHSVTAAAYGILRQIKEYRSGRTDSHDLYLHGLLSIAGDLESGKLGSIPENLNVPVVADLIQSIRKGIATGAIKGIEDISVVDHGFWKKFNAPANFLKHANRDPEDALDLARVNNEELLMRASAVFFEITNKLTPEIMAYYIFSASHLDDSGLPKDIATEFADLPQPQKRQRCLAWLEKQRESIVATSTVGS